MRRLSADEPGVTRIQPSNCVDGTLTRLPCARPALRSMPADGVLLSWQPLTAQETLKIFSCTNVKSEWYGASSHGARFVG